MKKAGEKRYDMSELRRGYKRTSAEEFVGDKTTLSKEKKTKTQEPSSGSTVKVKIENPLFVKYKQHLKVLNSGKGHHLLNDISL